MKEQLQQRLIPTYFNEFQCIGGACEDTCCAGWRIDIDQKTFKKYKKEKNPTIKNTLQKNITRNRSNNINFFNYGKFKMNEDTTCAMLTADKLCSIQQTLGAEALCHTCTIYPREIVAINDVVEKTLTLSCPEAARIVLNRPDGLDFIEEEGIEKNDVLKTIHQSPEEHELFWKLRIFMIDTLQNRKHSLETRLLIIAMFLQKYIELDVKNAIETENLIQQHISYLQFDDLNVLFSNIPTNYTKQLSFAFSILQHNFSPAFKEMTDIVTETLDLHSSSQVENTIANFKAAIDKTYQPFIKEYDFILENYLVNAVFEKIKGTSNEHLLNTFTSICLDFTMVRLLIIGYVGSKDQITLEDTLYCIQKYSKSLSHNAQYKKDITTFLQQDYASILSQITMMVHI